MRLHFYVAKPGAQTAIDFYFHYIRVTPLKISIDNERIIGM